MSQRNIRNDREDDDETNNVTALTTPDSTNTTQDTTIRTRTRGATIRLSASLRQLTRQQIKTHLATATINSEVIFTFAEAPNFNETTLGGKVVAAGADGSRLVSTPNGIFKLPFENMEKVLTHIQVVKKAILNAPIFLQNSDLDPMNTTIFLDGGSRPNPGASASAIVVRGTDGSTIVHSKFYPLATNNIVEAIAMLAALRAANRLLEGNISHVNVVTDSELVYKTLLGIAKCSDNKIAPIIEQCVEAFRPIAGRLTIATMRREHGNPADHHCTVAIQKAQGIGDQLLFIDPPVLPHVPRVQAPKPPSRELNLPNSLFDVPQSLRDFAQLRRLSVRSRVPATCIHLWATIVRHYLQLFLSAAPDSKEDALLRVMLLPHLFLPARVGTSRILRHMSICTPFKVSFARQNPDDADNVRTARNHRHDHRLTETVTRLVNDHKMRSANRILQATADAPELSHAEKVEVLKSKIKDTNVEPPTFPRADVPMFSPAEVKEALKSANRQAASAIDGMTKDLLEQAISHDAEIAAMLGEMLHYILTARLSPRLQQIILVSRGVALPKPEGGARPICISSLIVKLIGSVCMARDGKLPSHLQFAIGPKNGHQRIVHKVKDFIKRTPNSAILRFDVSNAYGNMPRAVVQSELRHSDPSLQQYFRLVYGTKTTVVAYGTSDDELAFIPLGEGVKQGDSTSSLFFCLGLDKALSVINKSLKEMGIQAELYAYMDDITICTTADNVDAAAKATIAALERIGLTVNTDKSKVLTGVAGIYILPCMDHSRSFVILGSNIAQSEAAAHEFETKLIAKQNAYFDILQALPLHPQITFTLLRICGAPRIQYHCSVTEPDNIVQATNSFNGRVRKMAEWLLDATGETSVSYDMLHSRQGLGMPDYTRYRMDLFNASQRMSLTDDPSTPHVSLTHDTTIDSTVRSQIDSQWLFYDAKHSLTPANFSMAISIRLNILPKRIKLEGSKCNCGFIYDSETEKTIEHILRCDMSTPITHTVRHNMVRDALIDCMRGYGITVTKEPTCFTYKDGKAQRPDILCHSQPFGVVTDVTLVATDADLAKHEQQKKDTHAEACSKMQCIFIPFAMHTRGTLGTKAEDYIRTICKTVQHSQQSAMHRDMHHVTSTAAAKGRAMAILAAADRVRW